MIIIKNLIILFFIIFTIPFDVFSLTDSSKSSIVMDVDSGRILYSKNMNNKQSIASITKIMTCIIVLEKTNLDDVVEVGDEILKMYGTNIYVEIGEKLKVSDLLYGLMLRSGNDAAIVLATYVSGSEKEFVNLMNEKAKEIGMKDTVFNNSHGLDDDTCNYSTAYDMALLSKYAFKNKKYRDIISTKKYSTQSDLKSYVWYNRMSLLNSYEYCIGGKNGYTPKAGKTLVSLAKKDGMILSMVSLNDSDLYDNHKKVYNYVFDKYKLYTIIDKDNFNVNSYFFNDEVYLKKSFKYPLSEDESKNISTIVKLFNETNDDVVGEVVIKLDNDEIGKLNIYKKIQKKEDKNIFQKFKDLIFR